MKICTEALICRSSGMSTLGDGPKCFWVNQGQENLTPSISCKISTSSNGKIFEHQSPAISNMLCPFCSGSSEGLFFLFLHFKAVICSDWKPLAPKTEPITEQTTSLPRTDNRLPFCGISKGSNPKHPCILHQDPELGYGRSEISTLLWRELCIELHTKE